MWACEGRTEGATQAHPEGVGCQSWTCDVKSSSCSSRILFLICCLISLAWAATTPIAPFTSLRVRAPAFSEGHLPLKYEVARGRHRLHFVLIGFDLFLLFPNLLQDSSWLLPCWNDLQPHFIAAFPRLLHYKSVRSSGHKKFIFHITLLPGFIPNSYKGLKSNP